MKPKRPKILASVERAAPAERSAPVGKATRWWAHAAVLLVLLLANLALYRGTLDLGFLSVDDPDYVQNNPYIENLSTANLKHILTRPYSANYAPANLLSYALDVALAKGKSAAAIHLSNVLWHGFVTCMVYLLAFTIRPRILTAAAAALLFLLHPAHVEVVAWISSRKDLVATSFAALAMAAYLRYRRRSRRCGWWYAGSVLAFLLASAGKQSVLLLPAVMLVWDLLVEKRRNWQMLADKVPFGLVTLFFGWMTWHAQPSTNQALNPFVLAATQFTNLWLLTGPGQYVLYRPAPNPAAWGQAARLVLIIAAVLVWFLPILLLTWTSHTSHDSLAGGSRRRQSAHSFGGQDGADDSQRLFECEIPGPRMSQAIQASLCYWVLIQMVPPMLLAFLVPITDRYLFLPSVGVCLLLVDLAAALEERLGTRSPSQWISVSRGIGMRPLTRPEGPLSPSEGERERERGPSVQPRSMERVPGRAGEGRAEDSPTVPATAGLTLFGPWWLPWAALAALAAVWGAKTWNYVGEWRDPRSVWYGAHLKTGNSQVRQFLGEVYQNAGDRVGNFVQSGAPLQLTNELHFARAVLGDGARLERLQAEWTGATPARTNSIAYRDQLWDLAWQQYEESVARRGTLSTPNLFMCRGRLLVSRGKFAQAIPEFQKALALAQSSNYVVVRNEGVTQALFAIGVAYWNMGNYSEAQQWLLKAQAVQRKSGQVWLPALDQEVERINRLAGNK